MVFFAWSRTDRTGSLTSPVTARAPFAIKDACTPVSNAPRSSAGSHLGAFATRAAPAASDRSGAASARANLPGHQPHTLLRRVARQRLAFRGARMVPASRRAQRERHRARARHGGAPHRIQSHLVRARAPRPLRG